MKIYGRYLFIPLIYGIIFSIYGTFHTTGPLPLLELVIDMGFGEIVSCSLKASAAILESYVPYLVFVILFSTYIYIVISVIAVSIISLAVKTERNGLA